MSLQKNPYKTFRFNKDNTDYLEALTPYAKFSNLVIMGPNKTTNPLLDFYTDDYVLHVKQNYARVNIGSSKNVYTVCFAYMPKSGVYYTAWEPGFGIFCIYAGSYGNAFAIRDNGYIYMNGVLLDTVYPTFRSNLDIWRFISITRNGASWSFYLNGVLLGTYNSVTTSHSQIVFNGEYCYADRIGRREGLFKHLKFYTSIVGHDDAWHMKQYMSYLKSSII